MDKCELSGFDNSLGERADRVTGWLRGTPAGTHHVAGEDNAPRSRFVDPDPVEFIAAGSVRAHCDNAVSRTREDDIADRKRTTR